MSVGSVILGSAVTAIAVTKSPHQTTDVAERERERERERA